MSGPAEGRQRAGSNRPVSLLVWGADGPPSGGGVNDLHLGPAQSFPFHTFVFNGILIRT